MTDSGPAVRDLEPPLPSTREPEVDLRDRPVEHDHLEPMTAVLDRDGVIVGVSPAWNAFTLAHGGDVRRCGVGASYLVVCDAVRDDSVTTAVGAAIRVALRGAVPVPGRFLSPCPGAGTAGWFELWVTPRLGEDGSPGASVTVIDTALYVGDPSTADLAATYLAAARTRDNLIADQIQRVTTQKLFGITLGLSSMTDGLAAEALHRLAVSLVAGLDEANRDLLALSALLRDDLTPPPGPDREARAAEDRKPLPGQGT